MGHISGSNFDGQICGWKVGGKILRLKFWGSFFGGYFFGGQTFVSQLLRVKLSWSNFNFWSTKLAKMIPTNFDLIIGWWIWQSFLTSKCDLESWPRNVTSNKPDLRSSTLHDFLETLTFPVDIMNLAIFCYFWNNFII